MYIAVHIVNYCEQVVSIASTDPARISQQIWVAEKESYLSIYRHLHAPLDGRFPDNGYVHILAHKLRAQRRVYVTEFLIALNFQYHTYK